MCTRVCMCVQTEIMCVHACRVCTCTWLEGLGGTHTHTHTHDHMHSQTQTMIRALTSRFSPSIPCIYICMYVYMCAYIHIYMHSRPVSLSICSTPPSLPGCDCVCILYTHTNTHIHMRARAHTHTHTSIPGKDTLSHTHTHTHTHTSSIDMYKMTVGNGQS
jgi:hypothetical protein